MAKPKGLICDECGVHEDEPRNWLTMDVQNGADSTWRPRVKINGNVPVPDAVDGYTRLDLCGQMCVYRRLGVLLFGEEPRGAGASIRLAELGTHAEDPRKALATEAHRKAEALMAGIGHDNPGFRGQET